MKNLGMMEAVYLFVKHRGGLVCWRPTQALLTALPLGIQWMNCPRGGYERDKERRDMNKNYSARVVVGGLEP